MRLFPAVLSFALLSAASWAETLPVGTVACLSEKYAKSYADYAVKAPDFAADLINRAACYINKDDAEVVPLASAKGFQQYQLLSGHKVWVAQAPRSSK